MIRRDTFTLANMARIRATHKVNPPILERSIYALGLVEALKRVGLNFVYKGGSCLTLLLKHPMRLSTDCDIMVPPGSDIDSYIERASRIYPFLRFEESKRSTTKAIEKRHFRFHFPSLLEPGKEAAVLLDVVFADYPFTELSEVEIANDLLLTEDPKVKVLVPSASAIAGDKMTAFAPHTIGIEFGEAGFSNDKRLEVIKQFYDVSTLYDEITDFAKARENYQRVAAEELSFRRSSASLKECLWDSFRGALCILSRGGIIPKDYPYYLAGIKRIKGHVLDQNFSAEKALLYAPKIMLLAAGFLSNTDVTRATIPAAANFQEGEYVRLNFLNRGKFKSSFNQAAFAISCVNGLKKAAQNKRPFFKTIKLDHFASGFFSSSCCSRYFKMDCLVMMPRKCSSSSRTGTKLSCPARRTKFLMSAS